MKKDLRHLTRYGVGTIILLSLLLGLSRPTYIIYLDEKNAVDYIKQIEKFYSFHMPHPKSDEYYSSLEKDTSFSKLVLSQLKGKEKTYFLQMRPFLSKMAKASQKTGIPMSLLASHIKRESQFNPRAVSNKGAYGLMGVTVWAYRDVVRLSSRKKWIADALGEYKNLTWERVKTDPELNIIVGAIYYKFLLDEFKDTTLASLAYNWGMGNVYLMQEKYGDKETILSRLEELASTYPAWIEPAEYPEHIYNFKVVFERVQERIKLAYATYKELNWGNLTLLQIPEENPSS